jgi:hypothetical protein
VRNDADVVVVTGGGRSGAEEVSVWDPHHDGVVFFVSREDFERAWAGHALMITPVHADANVVKLRPDRETTPDPAGDDSPTDPDVPKQQPSPSPMRTGRASKSGRRGETLRRSPTGSTARSCGNGDCGGCRYRTFLTHSPRRRPHRQSPCGCAGKVSGDPGHIDERKRSRAPCRRGCASPSRGDLRNHIDLCDAFFRWTGK